MDLIIYTDGACRGNQNTSNIGAWAYQLEFRGKIKECFGGASNTTNNIMELTAVIKALEALNDNAKNYSIKVYSDSQYFISGINEWCKTWELKKWKNIKNVDLWRQILKLKEKFPKIEFLKIKGHSGNNGNERVDYLCNLAMDNYKTK